MAKVGKSTVGWFFGFKLHLIINDKGEILSFYLSQGNTHDSSAKIITRMTKEIFGKVFGDKGYINEALADLLFENVGLNKREAKDMVEFFYEEVRIALQNNESVKLSGFGNFQLREKPQRPGRNPKTGEEIPITARRVVTFHASQKLKTLVEKNYHGKQKTK